VVLNVLLSFIINFVDWNTKYVTFSRFMHHMPKWSDKEKSYIFHRDDPSVQDKANVLLQRVQMSGNCYFHASAMLQHYCIAKHNSENLNPEILDITKFVSGSFGSDALQNYIFEDKGDNTARFLLSILEPGSKLKEYQIENIDEGVLRRYGPALVATFRVEDDFGAKNKLIYTGNAPSKGQDKDVHHAMLLIGIREEGGAPRFLLQNWWKYPQFAEFDAKYLRSCQASFYFVTTPQMGIKYGCPAKQGIYGEAKYHDEAVNHIGFSCFAHSLPLNWRL
jgi:hypothetical protein